jgi:N-methylhydantoinase B
LRATLDVIEQEYGGVREGEMWVVNDPYISGTHLNDVTVIRPIFFEHDLVGFAANKAHHTDVGGMVPGSMSADAPDLFAEGLVVPPTRLVECDRVVDAAVALFRANSRTPHARSGDLRAQTAGNATGERRMLELYERYGREIVEAAVHRLLDESEVRMRGALRALRAGVYEYGDVLEDRSGSPSIAIRLRLTLHDGSAHFDYTGTAAQLPFPMNAVYGVTLSGVYYALRAVTDPTIPMNDGCFRPVTVEVPQGTLLNPRRPAPVSGGNVETSTRNADVVLGALAQAAPGRVPAQSGGTMSNVMIGGTRADGTTWAFYETNGCGMGARPGMNGLDGIQCHMTNTLNTPIEAIERDYPMRVARYEFADGTGGSGRYRGGEGLVRALTLTEGDGRISLLAERHTVAPRGTQGGGNGATGKHELRTVDGRAEPLAAKTTRAFTVGQTLVIQTPGGGGYGEGDGAGAGVG